MSEWTRAIALSVDCELHDCDGVYFRYDPLSYHIEYAHAGSRLRLSDRDRNQTYPATLQRVKHWVSQHHAQPPGEDLIASIETYLDQQRQQHE